MEAKANACKENMLVTIHIWERLVLATTLARTEGYLYVYNNNNTKKNKPEM